MTHLQRYLARMNPAQRRYQRPGAEWAVVCVVGLLIMLMGAVEAALTR